MTTSDRRAFLRGALSGVALATVGGGAFEIVEHVDENHPVVVPMTVGSSGVLVQATVNGQPVRMVLDTGDEVGPVLTVADAELCGVTPTGTAAVYGSGGESQVYTCQVDIGLGNLAFRNEAGAVDPNIGYSLIGLPFFLAKTRSLQFDFVHDHLLLEPR